MTTLTFAALLVASLVAYALNRRAAAQIRETGARLHSLPSHHGLYALLSILVPPLALLLLWLVFQDAAI